LTVVIAAALMPLDERPVTFVRPRFAGGPDRPHWAGCGGERQARESREPGTSGRESGPVASRQIIWSHDEPRAGACRFVIS
jgi:hypothetical protein